MTSSGSRGLSFLAGEGVGVLLAPWFAAGSFARHARFFHPEGVCFVGEVTPTGTLSRLGERLGPHALVRLSTAWWRGSREWPDVLGIGLRFQPVPGAEPGPDDQDLLMATIPVPMLTPLSPLWTNVHDFLASTYYGTAPFQVDNVGTLRFRLRPRTPPSTPSGAASVALSGRSRDPTAGVCPGATPRGVRRQPGSAARLSPRFAGYGGRWARNPSCLAKRGSEGGPCCNP